MQHILDAARRYVAAGLSVIPIRHGTKLPDDGALAQTTPPGCYAANDPRAAWRTYTQRMPSDDELVTWFDGTDAQVGIVGGAQSGGLLRLDFEHHACLETWLRLLGPALGAVVATLPIVRTAKGHHVYLRMDDPPSYELLCTHGEGDRQIVLSETQGEGCYCVAPPSIVYALEEARQYVWANAQREIPTIVQRTAAALIEAARFPGFWQPQFGTALGRPGQLCREGLVVGPALYDWEQLRDLRFYLERYDALLAAVESAPPPPPSYIYGEEEDAGDDYDD